MLEPTAEWRVADSLNTLALQVNALWPGRSKTLDGTIGDAAHQARVSDHNPDAGGVVRARDITHDPESGADMEVLAEVLRETQDPRIKYVIRNKRIFSSYPTSMSKAWDWRPYGGWNPHTTHLHVSDDRVTPPDMPPSAEEVGDPVLHFPTIRPEALFLFEQAGAFGE